MFIGPISTLAGCTDFSLYATNVSLALRAEADISGDYTECRKSRTQHLHRAHAVVSTGGERRNSSRRVAVDVAGVSRRCWDSRPWLSLGAATNGTRHLPSVRRMTRSACPAADTTTTTTFTLNFKLQFPAAFEQQRHLVSVSPANNCYRPLPTHV